MESLQIAQILADLSDLQNTDPIAATNLLTSHRTSLHTQSTATDPDHSSAHGVSKQNAKFDRLGRRIITPSSRGSGTPTLTRAQSSLSSVGSPSKESRNSRGAGLGGSGAGTPSSEREFGVQVDEDLRRAKTLLELFEQRGRFKQMGDTGLLRSKERVDAVVAKYSKKDLEEKENTLRAKYLSPRS